jgi:hypothetical protein
MDNLVAGFGLLLVLAGVVGFIIGAVTLTRENTQVKLGNFKVVGDVEQIYPIPKWACAVSVLGGVGLILIGWRRRR